MIRLSVRILFSRNLDPPTNKLQSNFVIYAGYKRNQRVGGLKQRVVIFSYKSVYYYTDNSLKPTIHNYPPQRKQPRN